MNKKTYHFHFCRIKSDHDKFSITYGSTRFQIELVGAEFDAGKGMEISWEEDGDKDIEFLQWFSVYLGEDLINPFQEVDTRFSWHRGTFVLDPTPLREHQYVKQRSYYNAIMRHSTELCPLPPDDQRHGYGRIPVF